MSITIALNLSNSMSETQRVANAEHTVTGHSKSTLRQKNVKT